MNAITVTDLGRDYRQNLLDARQWFLGLLGGGFQHSRVHTAFDQISFSLPKGAILGVVGRNGAGKSTLLRVLAGIIRPSRGTMELPARRQALLQLGAGLHLELSGRENLRLQAVLLGMTSKQASHHLQKMAELSALSEDDLDLQLRYYSDGMRLRIAFAASMAQTADLWLVDEVIGVGDAGFLQGGFQFLSAQVKAGACLVLASHNLDLLRECCTHLLWLENGRARSFGQNCEQILGEYQKSVCSGVDKQIG